MSRLPPLASWPLHVVDLAELDGSPTIDLNAYRWHMLAEGDSWFSLGTLNLARASNLLLEMAFAQRCLAVQCATPGDTLRRMASMRHDPYFVDLLAGRRARPWHAVLLSAGGNDLIDALQADPGLVRGNRLLLTAREWGPREAGPERYLSAIGWAAFSARVRAGLEALVALRDRGPSAGRPMFLHGYAVPTPRAAGAGLGFGPWLLPALVRYAIPEADHAALAALCMRRLASVFAQAAAELPALHFFDSSAAVPLVPAAAGARGTSGDWINEIHLTRAGYRKVASAWCAAIAAVLDEAP